jgi:hypothetical protein
MGVVFIQMSGKSMTSVLNELVPQSVPLFLEYLKTTERGGLEARSTDQTTLVYWANGHRPRMGDLERAVMDFLKGFGGEYTDGNILWLVHESQKKVIEEALNEK